MEASSTLGNSVDVPALSKGLNLVVGILIIICAIVFMATSGSYLAIVVGLETIVFAAAVVVVELQAEPVLGTIRRVAPFLNTTRGEAFVSALVTLFLFGMGAFGIAMGVILFFTIVLNAYVYVAHPEAVADRQDAPQDDGGAGDYAPPFDDSPFAAPPPAAPSTADL